MSTNSTRRKSFVFFSRPSFLTDDADTPASWASKPRPKSALFGSTPAPDMSALNHARTRTLTKFPPVHGRSKSVFGSLKGKDKGEPNSPVATTSSASSSVGEEMSTVSTEYYPPSARFRVQPISTTVMHQGELVTSGGLLRRKKEFLVLTNRELLRYKSEMKANEALGRAPSTKMAGGSARHGRTNSLSIASMSDLGGDTALVTMMDQVVAVYHPGHTDHDTCSIQIDYFDTNNTGSPSSTVLMATTPAEAKLWVAKLREVSAIARATAEPIEFSKATVDHIVGKLNVEKDYSPQHFQIFRVVQRSAKQGARGASIEDLQKMYSTICYLAIGIHKVHLVPVKVSTSKAGAVVPALTSRSFAIMNLSYLGIADGDDGFSMSFRSPCRPPQMLLLASVHSAHIIQSIRQAAEYLRPMWQISPFVIDIPECMKDEPLPEIPPTPGDDLGGFDRTLAAYCTAYNLDASNIVYGIHTDVEDAPQFILYPPASRRRTYTDLELLAILRTLRWNDSIASISFARIPLDALIGIIDPHGREYEPRYLKGHRPLNLKISQDNKSLLVHELRALALYNSTLRRLDFSECITHPPLPSLACPIIEAIMPLCRRGLTNVDWFALTGIPLSEADLDWMIDAAASRLAHFRGFELSRCDLTERMLTLFLNALTTHENTLECLDLSRNPSRMHSPSLNNSMAYFPYLRKLNLSRLLRLSGNDAGLTSETLLRWRLEDLDLSETKLNEASVDALVTYLLSPQSSALRHLALTQCGLTGSDVARLLRAMSSRSLHLYIGQNALGIQTADLITCIASSLTPSHLTMRMTDYPREETFQSLLAAFTTNTTLRYLDISQTSLPYEAGPTTSHLLGELFANNKSIRELDVSGEQAVLESASLGRGLIPPLSRLAENTTLQILRIELQALGTPGAMELASLLTQNHTITQLHCEMNDIHLPGFTALVDAVEHNRNIIYLPLMERDRAEQMRALREKLCSPASTPPLEKNPGKLKGGLRKKRGKRVSFLGEEGAGGPGDPGVGGDVEGRLGVLEEKWESEVQRLRGYLVRNVVEMGRREAREGGMKALRGGGDAGGWFAGGRSPVVKPVDAGFDARINGEESGEVRAPRSLDSGGSGGGGSAGNASLGSASLGSGSSGSLISAGSGKLSLPDIVPEEGGDWFKDLENW